MTYDRLRVDDEQLLDVLVPRATAGALCASMPRTTA